ncbi:hypothetical protein [Pseudomonas fluorescens]|uniref:Uncharacterized protein n=3 Tax=Pseudomonas TaxID=286 RepID=A0A4Y9TL52_PSEFL|nr:hypothetical protein [Pseudomonas fluorescens]QXH69975.1 hypothetical protein KSS96_06025 [Pseudomonas asgharzadehiana]TKJ64789.1 hypothetical protein PspCFBP13506_07815 [Pseudomonas sp. CFBP13506]CRM20491.1 hypothetical protein [Pseudomonas sp. 31 E 5]CRM31742.1 hypothetical protein [Pseudomonas sp. 31 E 6]CRM96638.1 hypothetical protein [Pseudomonas sp. 22 E 5]
MSLTIASTDSELDAQIKAILKDERVSPVEFIEFRKRSDDDVAKNKRLALNDNLRIISNAADILADAIKLLTLEARRLDLGVRDNTDPAKNAEKDAEKALLKKAIEAQLAYTVVSYKSTLERL